MNLLKKENGGGGETGVDATLKWAKSPVSLVHRWQKYLG